METEFALSLGTQRWPLPATADEITLGRAANADVRLPPDDQISRIHARLVHTGATWALHDASRNGTGLNGRRLTAPTQLTDNDQINIGRSVLTFHAVPAAAGSSAAASASPQQPAPSPTAAPPAPAPAASGAAPGSQPVPGTQPTTHDEPPAHIEQPGMPAAPPAGAPPAGAQRSPYQRETNEAPEQNRWAVAPQPAEDEWTDGAQPHSATPDEQSGQLGTTPPPPAPARSPLTPRPAPPRSPAPGTASEAPDDSPVAPSSAHPEAPRNDPYPADRASISQPNPADAGNSASWPGYPSADYLESARSPWSGDERAQIETPRTPYPERVEYPDYPDEPNIGGPKKPKKPKRPERRPRENADEAGRVRLARVLAIAGAMLAVGLVINLIATFLADGPGGMLRWLIAPILALLGAMTFAVLDAVSPHERPPSRLDVSVVVAIAAVLVGVGIGGFAITSGAEYAAGYLSGNESGEDRLIKPVGKTTAGLAITVDNVTNTSHFTRIRLTVTNNGESTVSLPLNGNATFTSADGNSIRADGSRSNWPDKFPVGVKQQGTIVFKGHLPMGLKSAILTLRPGDPPIVLSSIPLSN